MNAIRGARNDPWWDDGVGARRTRTRRRVTSVAALGMAVVACGLTIAAWVHELFPSVVRLLG
jgi:hypothetical protein